MQNRSMPSAPPPRDDRIALRAAEPRDTASIFGLIAELAAFEQLTHVFDATPERLHEHLFGSKPVAEAIVVESLRPADAAPQSGECTIVGFALCFTSYSTFLARPGLWLEDLYVQPSHRGRGIGRSMLAHLAALAVVRGCGRFEWSVLDWNERAIRLYRNMGATVLPDWRICRVAGDALTRMAGDALTQMAGDALTQMAPARRSG